MAVLLWRGLAQAGGRIRLKGEKGGWGRRRGGEEGKRGGEVKGERGEKKREGSGGEWGKL